jgi:hypothetical protein
MSILDQFQHMLSRYLRAEISEADLLSSVATLKSSRSKAYQINGLKVTVISGSFKNLPPNLNIFVQASWCDQSNRTETLKRSSAAPVWGTSHVMQFERPSGVVSANILTFEVQQAPLFGRDIVLAQGEVYLPSLVQEMSDDLRARFGLTKVTISAGRALPNSKLNGFLEVQIVVDAQPEESALALPATATPADVAFEQLLDDTITEADFIQVINGHRRYCNSTGSNSQLLAGILRRPSMTASAASTPRAGGGGGSGPGGSAGSPRASISRPQHTPPSRRGSEMGSSSSSSSARHSPRPCRRS